MRIRIFREQTSNGKYYWNFTTKNYQDNNCKLKWFVKFVNCVEPITVKGYSNNKEYEYAFIDIQEMAVSNTTEYQGKINPSITIFAFNEVKNEQEHKASDNVAEKAKEFAKDNGIPFNYDDLPF